MNDQKNKIKCPNCGRQNETLKCIHCSHDPENCPNCKAINSNINKMKITVDYLESILREMNGKFTGKYEWENGKWIFYGNISSHITHHYSVAMYGNISSVGLTPDDVVMNIFEKITKGTLLIGNYNNYTHEYTWENDRFIKRELTNSDSINDNIY